MRKSLQSFSRCTVALRAFAVALALLSPVAISTTLVADGAPRPPEEPVFHDGRSVVRAVVATTRDVRTVLAIAKDVLNHRIDVGPVDFIVDADGLRALAKSGLAHEVLVPDLGPVLRADFAARAKRGGAGGGDGGVAGGGGFFDDFRRLEEIEAHLAALVAARPDLVTPFTIGTSLEGRPIRGVRITKAPAGSPGILFNATQHAREWGATTTACFIADRLVALEGTDPRVTALLSRAWVDVIPVVNPDGYVFSWDVNRLWRKNRRNNGDGSFGVDLNRNWAFQWGGGGASTSPDSETYRGPFAFSEPESAAMRDYFVAQTALVGHIDFHAYSQLVLSPWGYTTAAPPNAAGFNALGLEMRDAIQRATGSSYVAGPIASTLYVASGSSVDHAFGAHGVISWTIEVRDKGTYGFVMPSSEIVPNATENLAAALELADAAVDGAVVRLSGGAPATVEPDLAVPISAEVRVMRGAPVAGGVRLFTRVGSSGAFTETPMTETAAASFAASLPAAPCGARIEWYIEAATTVGVARSPRAPGAVYATQALATEVLFADTFETNLGWSAGIAGDTATSGPWTRVDPVGTIAQPENDSADPGSFCFVTGQGVVGGAAGAADVDNGITTLLSPPLDASDPESRISYRRWYSNNLGGAPNADSMPISISGDGGATWVLLEDVSENAGAWVEKSFRVADFVTPGAAVRLRFVARDLGQGSLVEAGVDFVRVVAQGCPPVAGDLDGDGAVGGADLALLLAAWGGSGAADLDGSGTVDAGDLSILLDLWS
jgi:murein tripeptide amidase MpaA